MIYARKIGLHSNKLRLKRKFNTNDALKYCGLHSNKLRLKHIELPGVGYPPRSSLHSNKLRLKLSEYRVII